MPVDEDFSGDYGYDCAHEAAGALSTPAVRRRSTLPLAGRTAGRELDPHGDFGYDQAHEV